MDTARAASRMTTPAPARAGEFAAQSTFHWSSLLGVALAISLLFAGASQAQDVSPAQDVPPAQGVSGGPPQVGTNPDAPNSTPDTMLNAAASAAAEERLQDARAILLAGREAYPHDERFAVELAGISFLEGQYQDARRWLRKAPQAVRSDDYVREFLGTLYLLDGNTEAALTLWNPLGKPLLADDQIGTSLETVIRPGLASSAADFTGGQILLREEALRSSRRVAMLDVCGRAPLVLEATANERFHAQIRCLEKSGAGSTLLGTAIMLSRGLAYQAVHLQSPNIGRNAASLRTMVRWDPRKRRAWAEGAIPIAGRADWRLKTFADARHEHWQMRHSDSGDLNQTFLQTRWETGIAIAAVLGSRSTWENRVSLANRSFTRTTGLSGVVSAEREAERLDGGSSVKYAHRIYADLLRLPLQRVFVDAQADGSMERYMGLSRTVYRGDGNVRLVWYPATRGDDGRTQLRIGAGALRGEAPLTDLYAMGLERDGAVPLRAHIGTRNGHKGSALFGDRFAVANLESQKQVLNAGIVRVALAPFLDAGWTRDPRGLYGARTLQFDAGLQLIAATLAGTEIRLSYGWNLRTGRSAFYCWSEPFP